LFSPQTLFRWTLFRHINKTFLEALINGTFFRQVIKPNILDHKNGTEDELTIASCKFTLVSCIFTL